MIGDKPKTTIVRNVILDGPNKSQVTCSCKVDSGIITVVHARTTSGEARLQYRKNHQIFRRRDRTVVIGDDRWDIPEKSLERLNWVAVLAGILEPNASRVDRVIAHLNNNSDLMTCDTDTYVRVNEINRLDKHTISLQLGNHAKSHAGYVHVSASLNMHSLNTYDLNISWSSISPCDPQKVRDHIALCERGLALYKYLKDNLPCTPPKKR